MQGLRRLERRGHGLQALRACAVRHDLLSDGLAALALGSGPPARAGPDGRGGYFYQCQQANRGLRAEVHRRDIRVVSRVRSPGAPAAGVRLAVGAARGGDGLADAGGLRQDSVPPVDGAIVDVLLPRVAEDRELLLQEWLGAHDQPVERPRLGRVGRLRRDAEEQQQVGATGGPRDAAQVHRVHPHPRATRHVDVLLDRCVRALRGGGRHDAADGAQHVGLRGAPRRQGVARGGGQEPPGVAHTGAPSRWRDPRHPLGHAIAGLAAAAIGTMLGAELARRGPQRHRRVLGAPEALEHRQARPVPRPRGAGPRARAGRHGGRPRVGLPRAPRVGAAAGEVL
mmetsp:Transcript_82678/g.252679  ORF Transcript_82678/g.252679 Transcript_82678/m.252679 type:complete len:340 (-) Transcript_82678:4954-5973(-)